MNGRDAYVTQHQWMMKHSTVFFFFFWTRSENVKEGQNQIKVNTPTMRFFDPNKWQEINFNPLVLWFFHWFAHIQIRNFSGHSY